MPAREIALKFRVSDDGTLRVFDEAERKLKDVERASDDFSRSASTGFESAARGAETLRASMVAVGTAVVGAGAALQTTLTQVDDITKLARAAGTATEEFSSLRTAATLSGVPIQELGQGLGLLNRRLLETTSGVGRAQNVFRALGVEVVDQNGALRSNVAVLTDVADVFQELPDGPQKTAAAMELFGRSGAKFINLLNSGAEGIRDLQEENTRLGLTFDETFGRQAEAVNDNIERLTLAGAGLATVFAAAVTPTLVSASEGLLQFLGIAESAAPDGRLGALIQERNRLAESDPRNRRGRAARLAELDRQIDDEQQRINPAISAAIRGVRDDLGLNDRDVVSDVEDVLSRLQLAMRESGSAASESSPRVKQLGEEYRKLPEPIRQAREELERTTETISLDFGGAVRRLTTGGNGLDLGDALVNTFQVAGADAVDAFLGEKLRLDVEVERNFAEDLPGFLEAGVDRMRSIFREGSADLVSESSRASDAIARNFGGGFQSAAISGQALAEVLAGTTVPTVGGTQVPVSLATAGNLAGGRVGTLGNRAFAQDAFGSQFTGPDIGTVAGIAAGFQQRGPQQQNNSAFVPIAVGASIVGPIIDAIFEEERDLLRTSTGTIDLTRDGLLGESFQPGTTIAGATVAGAAIGSVIPVIGTVVGGAVGAVVGALTSLIDELFGEGRLSEGDVAGKILDQAASRNSFILQQNAVEASGRRGIDADTLFGTPTSRLVFLTESGFPIPGNQTMGNDGDLTTDVVNALLNPLTNTRRPYVNRRGERDFLDPGYALINGRPQWVGPVTVTQDLLDAVNGPSLGLGVLLGQGNAQFSVDLANQSSANVLLSGVEFPEEARRQFRLLAEASGYNLRSAVEQVAVNFGEFGGEGPFPRDLRRDQLITGLTEVVGIFEDDIPAGVDVVSLALKHVGERTVNTGVLLENLDRQLEVFGKLEDTVSAGLETAIGVEFERRTPGAVQAAGGTVDEIIRASARQGSGFVSTLQTETLRGVKDVLVSQVFDGLGDELTDAIGTAVGAGDLGALPGIFSNIVGASLPQIVATQTAYNELEAALGTTPDALFGSSDNFRARAEQLRFGQLSPRQQLAKIDAEINAAQRGILRIYGDDIDDSLQVGELSELYTEIGNLGERRFGLVGDVYSGGGVANERAIAREEAASLGYLDFSAKGLSNLGSAQLDALTQNTAAIETSTATVVDSNQDLADAVRDLTRRIESGDIPVDVLARAAAAAIARDPVANAILVEEVVNTAR